MQTETVKTWAAIVAMSCVSLLCLVMAAQVQRNGAALEARIKAIDPLLIAATTQDLRDAAFNLDGVSFQLHSSSEAVAAVLESSRLPISSGLRDWQLAGMHAKGLLVGQKDEWFLPENVLARKHSLRFTDTLVQQSTDTFGKVNQLIENLDARLNGEAGALAALNELLTSSRYLEIEAKVLSVLEHADITAAEIERAATEIAALTEQGSPIADEIKAVLVQTTATLKAGEGTLNQGTKTLGTLRKVSIAQVLITALAEIGRLGFK